MEGKKIIALLLGICTGLGLLAGCKKEDGEDSTSSVQTNKVMLNAFEGQSDLDTMQMFGMLGIVRLNEEKTFVKEGTRSAKITVETDPCLDGAPYLFQATNLTNKELDYTEFSQIGYLTFDVYNAQAETRQIGVQLVYEDDSTGVQKWIELSPGWNAINYAVERTYIPTTIGNGGVEERLVAGINLHFKRGESGSPDENYYLDNMQLHKTQTAVDKINMTLAPNEILSFDKKWQVGMLTFGGWMAQGMLPNLSIAFLDNAPERGGVLKIEQPAGYGAAADTGHYMGFEVSKELLSKVSWGSYDENAMLCFDIYCPAENGIKSIDLEMQDDLGRKYYKEVFGLTPGHWNEIRISVRDLNKGRAEIAGSQNRFAYTNAFMILYGEEIAPIRTLYVDNIRMEIQ